MPSALTLLAITAVGLAIRLWQLDAHGTWFDEAYHAALIREPGVPAMLGAVLANPPGNPLYPVLLRAWADLAGIGDAALRVPSVIAGTLTIPATAWLGRELDGRRGVGLLAAAAVAVSPYAIEFSREAAPYALASFATTAALAAGWRWRRTGADRDGVVAVVLAIAAVYTHYVVPVVLGLAWLAGWSSRSGRRWPDARRWLGGGLVVLGAYLPWIIMQAVAWSNAATPRATLALPARPIEVAGAVAQYAVGTAALLDGQRPLVAGAVALAALLVVLGWRDGAALIRRGLRVVAVVAALVLVVPALASVATGSWLFVAHFGLFSLPAVTVVAAAGVARIHDAHGGSVARRRIAGVTVVVWAIVAGLGTGLFFVHPPHGADGLRELVATLESEAAPDDPVLVAPAILAPSIARYSDRRLVGIPEDFDLRDMYTPYVRPASAADLRATVRRASGDRGTVWLIVREELPAAGPIVAELQARLGRPWRYEAEFATLLRFGAAP